MVILTILAIVIGPTIGVLITLWSNSKKEKNLQRMNLFLKLLAYRKSYPFPIDFVNALNMIDVIYHDYNKVINAWKKLFASFHAIPYDIPAMQRKLLDLLDEMAKSLGYLDIKQTAFDSFYEPKSEMEKKKLQGKLDQETLRVLKNSQSFGIPIQPNQNNHK
ncbi:hypothetical protein D4R71_00140 [bacterium]|nr:MAG: hypothetical protein D4R71_00140 [bacterium]